MGAVGFTSGDPRKLNRAGYNKGDVVAADAAGELTAVPVGADTEVLTADSSDPEGVDWAPGGGGGGGGTPSNTVVAETVYGQASTAGAASTFSRGDHTHGSPSLTSSAPATTHGIGQAAVLGSATTPARADHVHPVAGSGTPSTSAVGDAAAQGAASTFARSDHAHGREAFAAPGASAVGDSAAAGSAATVARSDHRHGREAFGAVTAQTSFGQASGNGVATTVSRSDHTHGTPAAPSIPSAATTVEAETSYGLSSAVGAATDYARSDHTHGSPSLTSATPAAETIGAVGAVGVATTPARADHVHGMPAAGTPGSSAVGDSASAGSAGTLARSDHVHGREAFGAVTTETGYGQASANGSAATVARSDHTHGTPSLGTSGTTAAAGNDSRIVNAVQQTLLDAKGDLIAASAADTPARLPAGSDGQFLRANSAAGTGLEWDTATASDVGAAPSSRLINTTAPLTGGGDLTADRTLGVSVGTSAGTVAAGDDSRITGAQQRSALTAKGDLYAATASATVTRQPVGSDGQVLRADSGQATGMAWDTLDAADVGAAATSHNHAATDITSATLAVDRGGTGIASYTTNNYIRASASTTLEQRTPSQVLADIAAVGHSVADAKGDLLVASAADTFTRLPVGSNGQVLTADSAESTGVKWAAAGGGTSIVGRRAYITTGDTTLPNTSGAWAAISGYELSIPAAVGDYVELQVSLMFDPGTNGFLDVAIIVSTTLARFASSGTGTPAIEGDPTLYDAPQTYRTSGTHFGVVVASGDRDGSNVRFVMASKSAGSGILYSSSNYPFRWRAFNYGAVAFS